LRILKYLGVKRAWFMVFSLGLADTDGMMAPTWMFLVEAANKIGNN
jgi:hypothetical protein